MHGKNLRKSYFFFVVLILSLLAANSFAFYHKLEKKNAPHESAKASIERGRYLAAICGCGDCHTPWKLDSKLHKPVPDISKMLSGTPEGTEPPKTKAIPPEDAENFITKSFKGPWGTSFASNLTPDPGTGIGSWSFNDFKRVLREGKYKSQWGHKGDGRPLMPPMPWEDYAQMTDKDLHDLYQYLQSVKPLVNKVPEYIPPGKTEQ